MNPVTNRFSSGIIPVVELLKIYVQEQFGTYYRLISIIFVKLSNLYVQSH